MHEHERAQDPAYGSSGGQAAYGSGKRPADGSPEMAYGSGARPGDGSGGQQPGYGSGSQLRSGTGRGQPTYGSGGAPLYGSSDRQPGYGSGHGYPAGRQEPPAHDTSSQRTDAFWFGSGQPYGAGDQQPPYPWQPPGAGGWPPPPGTTYGQWGSPPPPPRRGKRALAFAVVAMLGAGIGAAAAYGIANNSQQPPTSSPGAQSIPVPGARRAPLQNTGTSKIDVRAISAAVSPSVVNVTSKLQYSNETAEGTGIVLSSSGLVLTNNHVVNGATNVTAQISTGNRTYTATVLGTDKTDDVALLRLQGAAGLATAAVGDSSKVGVGDPVVALGNVGGQGGTPTVVSGSITGTNRTITAGDQGSSDTETLHGLLQTNAGIESGDSGGPLANAEGQVIGVDTAAASNSFGQSENVGFAIPINRALSIARDIAAGHGSSTIEIGQHGFLGVGVRDISEGCQGGFGNVGPGGGFGGGFTAPVNSGALVCDVYNSTPAQSTGLAGGDVITGLNGTTITSAESLTKAMQGRRPGGTVSLTWVDTTSQRHTSSVILIAGPAD